MPSLLHGQAEAGRLRRAHRSLRASLRPPQVRHVTLASQPTSFLEPERRATLRAVKLGALVRDHFDVDIDDAKRAPFPGGAALHDRTRAWVLADDDPVRSLGRALGWANHVDAKELHLLVDSAPAAGVLARRAQQFALVPSVWRVEDRSLRPARAESAPVLPSPSPAALALSSTLAAAGVDVVVEHGVVTGQVLGLEIARITTNEHGEPRIEVGVGRHDREAFFLLHGDLPPETALAEVVGAVRRFRRSGAPDHPLRRLAPERWLREIVIARPQLARATLLHRIDSPTPPVSVKDTAPAAAAGVDRSGRRIVVVCSVGIDLDLVSWAADTRAAHDPGARLTLVLPERDDHRATRRLASLLSDPANVRIVPNDWRSLA